MSVTTYVPKPAMENKLVVRIYIDNSNLWIEGRKTYAKKKGLDTRTDPTWRFDVGSLKTTLLKKITLLSGNIEVKTNLYGSRPPPVDTVWEAIKCHEVYVHTSKRSTWTGGEKGVDQQLTADAAFQVSADYYTEVSSEYIIVSGDRDLLSAVNKIADNGFPVHVWSWKDSLASAYYKGEQKDRVHVHLLDEYIEDIGFCETTFRVDRSTIDPHSIVVIDPLPMADAIDELVSKLKTPVYRYECRTKRPNASNRDLVIIQALARMMKPTDLEDLFQHVKARLEHTGLIVLSYSQRSTKESREELAISNRFDELLHVDNELERYAEGVDNKGHKAEKNSEFIQVNTRSRQRMLYIKRNEEKARSLCQWGLYCRNGLGCKYGHTKDELDHFKTYGHMTAKKYRLCDKPQCNAWSYRCRYAHSEDELFCPGCGKEGIGHEMWNCPERSGTRFS